MARRLSAILPRLIASQPNVKEPPPLSLAPPSNILRTRSEPKLDSPPPPRVTHVSREPPALLTTTSPNLSYLHTLLAPSAQAVTIFKTKQTCSPVYVQITPPPPPQPTLTTSATMFSTITVIIINPNVASTNPNSLTIVFASVCAGLLQGWKVSYTCWNEQLHHNSKQWTTFFSFNLSIKTRVNRRGRK